MFAVAERRKLANEGDLVRTVRDVEGRMPSGELYRATQGTLMRVVERRGEWLKLESVKYGALCAADQGDVVVDSRAKRATT